MNKITLITLGSLFAAVSFTSSAAEQVQYADSSMQEVGVVSVLNAESPDDLMTKLAQKADAIGASHFKVVTLTSQDNNERGTAIAYR